MADNTDKKTGIFISSSNKLRTGIIHTVILILVVALGIGIGAALSLKRQAKVLKYDIKSIIACMKDGNFQLAEFAVTTLDSDLEVIRVDMNTPVLQAAANVPLFKKDFESLNTVISCVEGMSDDVFKPAVALSKRYPLKTVKTDEGINDEALSRYVRFAADIIPVMSGYADKMKNVEFVFADMDGKITEYISEYVYICSLLYRAENDIILPAAELTANYPVSGLRKEEGLDMTCVSGYLRYCETALPAAIDIINDVDASELSLVSEKVDNLDKKLEQLKLLTNTADGAVEEMLAPLAQLLKDEPLDQLSLGFGFNVQIMADYIDLLTELVPKMDSLLLEMSQMDVSELDKNGKLAGYCQKVQKLLDTYHQAEDYLPLLRKVIGDGEDKTYVFTAQNSSEMRASGGFPGAVAIIEVKNGVLTIGSFSTVKNTLAGAAYGGAAVTNEEQNIFGMHTGLAWDACYIPDFERVGKVWASKYEMNKGVHVDGVLSMTPAVIQEILAAFDEEIYLSDGTLINGTNATSFLQHDVYSRYFTSYVDVEYANVLCDNMFSETAMGAVQLVLKNINASSILKLIEVFRKGAEDRSITLWMDDEEAQKLCVSTGCSGTLNRDENNPVAGVFISGYYACKLGWFLDLDYDISEPVVNADNSRSYEVTVSISNIMTYAEADSLHYYVTAGVGGAYALYIHYFAPAGGTISDIEFSKGTYYMDDEYQGLQDIHVDRYIYPGEVFTATYTVTTAPGVEAPLGMMTTPTLTAYH